MPRGVYPRTPISERLLSRLTADPSGCLLWAGPKDRDGYGRIQFKRVNGYVHRVAYEAFIGPIAPGMHVDHLCYVRSCAAPAHLEVVSASENSRRMWERRRKADR